MKRKLKCYKCNIELKKDIGYNCNNIGGYSLYCPKCNWIILIPMIQDERYIKTS